uniref:hypothetical protein n=1 Tax=Microbispora bryophytorum TaxID=1460882 RepID=UPI003570BD46
MAEHAPPTGDGLADGEAEGLGDGEAEGDGLGDGEADGEGLGDGETEGLGDVPLYSATTLARFVPVPLM